MSSPLRGRARMKVLFATMKVDRARQVFARYDGGILVVVVVDIL